MTDLTARLLAEIERREALAREATPGPWHWEPPSEKQYPEADESLIGANDEPVLVGWGYDASGIDARDEDRAFIASNGPECVLAYLAALRKIVSGHNTTTCHHVDTGTEHEQCIICSNVMMPLDGPEEELVGEEGAWPCPTVAIIAEALDVSP